MYPPGKAVLEWTGESSVPQNGVGRT